MAIDELDENILLKKWRAQLSKGVLEFLVLILLQKEKYGWDILQMVRLLLPTTEPPLTDGTIYNVLTRLKRKSLVTFQNKNVDGRTRTYYNLSEKGEELLHVMKKDWIQLFAAISEAEEMVDG
ncbi:MAG: PadR family transcriptional regulator [Candidatus Heimdallarchaeota archaeon]|nr:PadR family transcriptional regulator [Candidatus Heimdallarchaeota archaeon]